MTDTGEIFRLTEYVAQLRAEVERLTRLLDAFHDGVKVADDNERLIAAIQATASQGTYDEIAIRKAVSFELAELIVDARRALVPG